MGMRYCFLMCMTGSALLQNEQSHHLKDIDISKLITSANILSNLVATLEHHGTYSCKTKKYGTLLYRPHTDLTVNFARAFCKLCQKLRNSMADSGASDLPSPKTTDNLQVLNQLNSLACSHINSYLRQHRKDEFELSTLTIDAQIENIDPRLWEALMLLTRSMSEGYGVKTSLLSKHTKE